MLGYKRLIRTDDEWRSCAAWMVGTRPAMTGVCRPINNYRYESESRYRRQVPSTAPMQAVRPRLAARAEVISRPAQLNRSSVDPRRSASGGDRPQARFYINEISFQPPQTTTVTVITTKTLKVNSSRPGWRVGGKSKSFSGKARASESSWSSRTPPAVDCGCDAPSRRNACAWAMASSPKNPGQNARDAKWFPTFGINSVK